MRNQLLSSVLVLVAVFVFASVLRAQSVEQPGVAKARASVPTVDLSGVWEASMPGAKWAGGIYYCLLYWRV